MASGKLCVREDLRVRHLHPKALKDLLLIELPSWRSLEAEAPRSWPRLILNGWSGIWGASPTGPVGLRDRQIRLRIPWLEYPGRMNPDESPTLVAFDGSAAARQAVAAAAALLKPRTTLVLAVWEAALAQAAVASPPDVAMTLAVDPSAMLTFDEALRGHAERVSKDGAELARSLGLDAEPLAVVDAGDIARTIAEVAREHKAATIVIGSRGLSGLRARFEGSTSKGVVKHAPCPVIVVHDDWEEESG
jgi:nucleotide-binding universal stress UspA family protein